jgi:hypothetical protein
MLYGKSLNRSTRVKPVRLPHKPLSNIVEANITWETSEGLAVPTKNGIHIIRPPSDGWLQLPEMKNR